MKEYTGLKEGRRHVFKILVYKRSLRHVVVS